MTGGVSVERVYSEKDLLGLEKDWKDLEKRTHNTLPFRTFTWVLCWWRHLREDRSAARDTLCVRVARDGEGRLVFAAPFILTDRPGRFALARYVHFIGADPNMTEVPGVLCERESQAACFEAARKDVLETEGDLDWILWSGIEGSGWPASSSVPLAASAGESCCYLLELPKTWDALRASRPRNLKESLRHCYNAPKRDGLSIELDVVRQGPSVGEALTDFFRLHAARSELRGTVPHPNVFHDEACRSFLVEACDRYAAEGALRIYRLHLGGKLVATRVGFVVGRCLYLYYSGYDPEYAKYSVMTTALAEAIRSAISEGFEWVNLSSGADQSKLRWRPEVVRYHHVVFFGDRSFARAKYQAFQKARRALKTEPVRRYVEYLGLARRAP